jgi:hypothetical protein
VPRAPLAAPILHEQCESAGKAGGAVVIEQKDFSP